MLVRLVAWITRGKIVAIEDVKKESMYSIAYMNSFNNLYCHVYYIAKVGYCILLEDGLVDSKAPSNYIRRWKYYA